MTNVLAHISTVKLVAELERRNVFSQLVALLVAQPSERPSEPATQLPVKSEPTPDKAAILQSLGQRLNAMTDTRTEEDVNGVGDSDAPLAPTKYIVTGAEREVLTEAALAAMSERLEDESLPAGERAELAQQIALRRSSSMPSLGTAGTIAANLRNGAAGAFLAPKLRPEDSKGVTAEELHAKRSAWVRAQTHFQPIEAISLADLSEVMSRAMQDAVLRGVIDAPLQASNGGAEVLVGDMVVTSRMLYILADLLAAPDWQHSEVPKAIYAALSSGPQALPPYEIFQANPRVAADIYRDWATAECRDERSLMPADQRLHMIRRLNPVMLVQAIPQSFYDDGPGGSGSRPSIRREVADILQSQGQDPDVGVFRPTSRPPRVTGNFAGDQAWASMDEEEEDD